MSLICKVCNKTFEVKKYRISIAKYCSDKCRHLRNGAPIKYNCLTCKREFQYPPNRPRKYCSHGCANKGRHANKTEPNKENNFRRFWLRRGIIKKCERCGYDEIKEILGIHHIDKNRKNNKRENLMVLCPMCHSLIHRKHIPH